MKPVIVFSDFDGTLTTDEKLGPIFFDILNLLEKHNTPLVVVSGRSLSWGHFLLTHFPLDYAIMEGGGVILKKEGKFIHEDVLVCSEDLRRLENLSQKLLRKFKGLHLSSDSFGRKTDRAIELLDFRASTSMEQEIVEFLIENEVNFSTSNVHLNFWCGEISKYNAVQVFLEKYAKAVDEDCLFFGDSLNDESMFRYFKNSVGVSNIEKVIDRLQFKPSIILEGQDFAGPHGVYRYLDSLLK